MGKHKRIEVNCNEHFDFIRNEVILYYLRKKWLVSLNKIEDSGSCQLHYNYLDL